MALSSLENAFAAVESVSGLSLCIKIFDARLAEGSRLGRAAASRRFHQSPFCHATKRRHRPECLKCCLQDRPAAAARQREPFRHVCHAGAEEWLVPVHVGERLVALAYLGPLRTGKGRGGPPARVRPAQEALLPGMLELLREYLAVQVRQPVFPTEAAPGYRKEAIEGFLRDHLHENPRLPDLARHLNLSTPRTAHAVAEATGRSFTALRDAIRLERATRLLQTTYQKVAAISGECGFPTTQYFHRFFRRKTGTTPAAYRRQHRHEA